MAEEKIDVSINHTVPPHEVLPEAEEAKLLKKFGLASKEQLPKIRWNDPQVKRLEAKPGRVIKMLRPGEVPYYRVVEK